MTLGDSGFTVDTTVSYIETDIDCAFCLADVMNALMAARDVEQVTSSSGCLVVTHRMTPASLLEIVFRHGHRLVESDNGEVAMGPVAAASFASCDHCEGQPSIDGSQ